MNLKHIVAGALAGTMAATPVVASAQEQAYAGTSANSAYTRTSETPIRDSIARYASSASVDSIVDSVNKNGYHFIKGDPGQEFMAKLQNNLYSAQGSQNGNGGMSGGKKAAIIALVVGGAVIGYVISQKGKDGSPCRDPSGVCVGQ